MLSFSFFTERSFLLFKAKLASGFQKPKFSSPSKWCSWVSVTCRVLWEDRDTWSHLSLLWGLQRSGRVGVSSKGYCTEGFPCSKSLPSASLVQGFKTVHLQGILKSWLCAHRRPSGIHWAGVARFPLKPLLPTWAAVAVAATGHRYMRKPEVSSRTARQWKYKQMFLLSSVKVWRLYSSPECLDIQPLYLMWCHVLHSPMAEAVTQDWMWWDPGQ